MLHQFETKHFLAGIRQLSIQLSQKNWKNKFIKKGRSTSKILQLITQKWTIICLLERVWRQIVVFSSQNRYFNDMERFQKVFKKKTYLFAIFSGKAYTILQRDWHLLNMKKFHFPHVCVTEFKQSRSFRNVNWGWVNKWIKSYVASLTKFRYIF